ncbi:unnamed protein product [Miscanthus lutarioriparius]|uniref:Protein kinase domain-containing protein n=1 Tax=Miscanthus lutarioriparius TaxID=422564 RepID=A0A811RID3_9POAL|nr:unnamed protein product [Miscanthus lutarioriparius]
MEVVPAALLVLCLCLCLCLCPVVSPVALVVHGQLDTLGFISIDCGIAEGAAYADQSTRGLRYVSDAGFADAGAGLNAAVNPPYNVKGIADRYFPDTAGGRGARRSCYTLRPVTPGGGYLVRATFYYGNYDALNRLPVFDLHLGVNRWVTVNVTAPGAIYIFEAVVVPPADFFQVCLVNRGLGTPFISGLDLRPLQDDMYPEATVNQSLALLNFRRPTATYSFNRYHFWRPGSTYPVFRVFCINSSTLSSIFFIMVFSKQQAYGDIDAWTNITSSTPIDVSNISSFHTSSKILWSATTPVNGTQIDFAWSPDSSINNDSTSYLLLLYFVEVQRLPSSAVRRFDILVDNSTWNGSQRYTPKHLSAELVKRMVLGSRQHTVSLVATPDATLPPILNAFEIYSVMSMTELAMNDADGISFDTLLLPKMFSVNLHPPASCCVQRIMGWAHFDCKLIGIGNNANMCNNGASTCEPENKNGNRILVIAIVVPIAGATLLFVAALLILRRLKHKQVTWTANNSRLPSPQERSTAFGNRQFTYKELKLMTANFKEEIGRGGFGAVFLGYLENGSPVAIKMCSKTSQGDKEFSAEAQHLTRVHHRNLVSLIGYCKDKKNLALVFEYMQGGNLDNRLRGQVSAVTPLTWHQRLKIALDSAHGLEYLHKACQPPLIHRDVKTTNILLSADLEAKISDFGLMKVFADDFNTHITTQPALSEKSDVYSFGVVLLELITGQTPAVRITSTDSIHIALWVRQKLSMGNVESIVDPRMGGEYDVNSVWKVAELSLQCIEQPSREWPTMTHVVMELKETLELDALHGMGYYSSEPSSTVNLSATSVDLQSDAQASEARQETMLELEQVGNISETQIGPAPR